MFRNHKLLMMAAMGGGFNPLNSAGETKIYGVSWDGSDTPTLTRTDDAVGMVAAAGVDANAVTNNFDTAEIYKNMSNFTDSLGNVFVRIPKFYIEKTVVGAACTWRISRTSFSASCYVPKCFGSDGWAYIGKYNASLSISDTLESLPNKIPLTSKNISEFRGYAQANGAGYHQFDIHASDLLQVLFLVEFATLNSQSVMAGFTSGAYNSSHTATANEAAANRVVVSNAVAALFVVGQTIGCGAAAGSSDIFTNRIITSISVVDASNKAINFDGAPADITIGNVVFSLAWKSGFSAAIAAKSGCPSHLTNGLYPAMYRGVENSWGNIWQFVDGVNVTDNQAWVCPTHADYASGVFAAPYLVLGYANAADSGNYPVSMGYDNNYPYAQLPLVTGGNNSAYYADIYYDGGGSKIVSIGGSWYGGAAGGLFARNLSDAPTGNSIAYGGRLQLKN